MTAENHVDRAVQLGVETFGGIARGSSVNSGALNRLAHDYALRARGYRLDGETPEVLPQVPIDELEEIKKGLVAKISLNLREVSLQTL